MEVADDRELRSYVSYQKRHVIVLTGKSVLTQRSETAALQCYRYGGVGGGGGSTNSTSRSSRGTTVNAQNVQANNRL